MTAFRRVFLNCDGRGDFMDSNTIPSARTVEEARQEAVRRGWRHENGSDHCENCREVTPS